MIKLVNLKATKHPQEIQLCRTQLFRYVNKYPYFKYLHNRFKYSPEGSSLPLISNTSKHPLFTIFDNIG